MPNSETAKTASAPKRFLVFSGLVLVAATIVVALAILSLTGRAPGQATLHVDGRRYALEVAASDAAQEKGLGDRRSLPKNSGMLFWFPDQQTRCFWMKDMHFPLDIIWINSDQRVVHMEENISPQSYPHNFCPVDPARYVIEARAAHIRQGQTLTF
jgi:uncharacterized membrane protein (UPF0127 family)